MEPHQKMLHPCPYCQKDTLEVLTWPAHTAVKSSRSAVAKSTTYQRRPEGFELLSERCSNCGNAASEIKKAWKEGTAKNDNEKRRKRLEELKSLGFSGIVASK
jgi:hypothetical protein